MIGNGVPSRGLLPRSKRLGVDAHRSRFPAVKVWAWTPTWFWQVAKIDFESDSLWKNWFCGDVQPSCRDELLLEEFTLSDFQKRFRDWFASEAVRLAEFQNSFRERCRVDNLRLACLQKAFRDDFFLGKLSSGRFGKRFCLICFWRVVEPASDFLCESMYSVWCS